MRVAVGGSLLGLLVAVGCGSSSLPVPGVDASAGGDGPIDRPETPAPVVDAPVVDAPVVDAPVVVGDTTPPGDTTPLPSGELPPECRVTPGGTPPFDVIFRLVNRTGAPVYLATSCGIPTFGVSSCASRYTEDLGPKITCACPCGDPACTGPVACGPCAPDSSLPIAPGQSRELSWRGEKVTVQALGNYSCVQRTPLPSALYSVDIPLFDSAEAAVTPRANPARRASRVFPLPAPGAVVELVIASGGGDGGADGPVSCLPAGQPAAVCAPPWSPATTCDLGEEITFGATGGLSPQIDESVLAPPGRYTHTIEYRASSPPTRSCTSDIPRCGASPDTFTTATVVEALSAPDVMSALAEATPPVYGLDNRPVDGQLLQVKRKDGHGVLIGPPCTGGMFCQRPVTPGIARLADVLRKIEPQQRNAPGCEALRGL